MIVLRNKMYSELDRIVDRLEKTDVKDYTVVDKVSSDDVNILGELRNTEIYVPEDYDDLIYKITDFLKRESRFLRTRIIQAPDKKNMRILIIDGSLTLPQYTKLVKFITEESDFCKIVK
jgi:hypothetical protein